MNGDLLRTLAWLASSILTGPLAAQQVSSSLSRSVDATVAEDKEVAAFLAPRTAEIRAEYSRVVVRAAQALRRGSGAEENLLGYWACDAMREAASRLMGVPVHAAITNRGGLRQDLPPGDITVGDLSQVAPFENELVVVEIDGADLIQAVKEGLPRRGGEPLSGLKVSVGGSPEALEVEVRFADGSPVDPKATYRLATHDYLYGGGDSIPSIRKGRRPFTAGITVRQCLVEACQALKAAGKELVPPTGGRYSFAEGLLPLLRGRR